MVSTQQQAVKQKWMEGYDVVFGDDVEVVESTEFGRALETQVTTEFQEGEVFKGNIISVGPDYVMVDIGYKQEGLIPTKEFMNYDGTVKVAQGDRIEVYLEKLESSMGNLVLSKDKAEILKAWDKISLACEQGDPVEGTVIAKVKGGLSVDIGVKAFLPGSQIDLRPTRNLDKFIGKTMQFKVIKFNKKRGNIVLSRRAILSEERNKMRGEILDQIQEGMIVKGIVKNITDYGAFIDLGGIDGLLHITDMSWGRVKHPSNILNIGDEIEVKILKFDHEKERVSLGLKQVQPNPWESAAQKYGPGSKVTGEVVSVKDYGIFVELDDGIEGLIHVSEMSWTGKIKNPAKHFNIGDKLEAQVIDVDIENKRISLGLKQLLPNPWDDLEKKYSVGTVLEAEVVRVTEFGAFVELETGIEGLIHISELSEERVEKPSDVIKKGDKPKAMVISLDKDAKKIALSIKAAANADSQSTAHYQPDGAASKTNTMADKLKGFSVAGEGESEES